MLMRVDTLTIDASAHEAPVVTLLWRGWLPLPNLDLFDEVSMVEVHLGELGQEAWLDEARAAASEVRAKSDGEKLEGGELLDEDADGLYREEVHMRKRQARSEQGEARESGGTAIIDITSERALTDDAFFDRVQADKEAFESEAEARAENAKKERDKALKKKAREMVDEEFGIEREGAEE